MAKNERVTKGSLLVIGGSAGSLDVLLKVLPNLNMQLSFPIVIVLHRKSSSDSMLSELFATRTSLAVKEVEDKQPMRPGHIYLAPADYHLLFEKEGLISLDYSEKVNYSRPSIDVSFESAAEVFGPRLTGLSLSGANADGMEGLKLIKEKGGRVAVQDPNTANSPFMPGQAILNVEVDQVLKTEEIAAFINLL